jgi:hypothetical protein
MCSPELQLWMCVLLWFVQYRDVACTAHPVRTTGSGKMKGITKYIYYVDSILCTRDHTQKDAMFNYKGFYTSDKGNRMQYHNLDRCASLGRLTGSSTITPSCTDSRCALSTTSPEAPRHEAGYIQVWSLSYSPSPSPSPTVSGSRRSLRGDATR